MSSDPPKAEVISEGAPPHKPFIAPDANVAELTPITLIMGSVLGIVFAMSSVYLGLKVGLTVSASIPVAVLSITLFRWMRLNGTILQNNIVQTTGSAGESLAAGVAFTLPSLLLMGFDMELLRIMLVALLGGLIGVLMMIPLRHGLIVQEHGKLAYPEGTACADVLIVGEKGGTDAKTVFTGFFIGMGYSFLELIMKFWPEESSIPLDFGGKLKKGSVGFEVSPPMLGVGYIIGPKVSANMLAGGLLAFVVLIPLIAQFGGAAVAKLSPNEIRSQFILYIGAGAVATGGFIALGRSIPTIISAFRRGMGNIGTGNAKTSVPRTEQDLSMKIVLGGSAAIAIGIALAPMLDISFVAAILVVLFGFFFVTVSSRITGEIGSSSNPISGMTIATLLLTCGLFVIVGWVGVGYKAMALTTAALVCVAASNGGTISQDLKTGYLVGATPKHQQVAILVGVITSAIAIGFTMRLLDDSRTTYQGVRYDGVAVKATSETGSGPDGKSYHVAYLREEIKSGAVTVPRGKYLVEDDGSLAFRVDSSVGNYPWKLEKASGAVPQQDVDKAIADIAKAKDPADTTPAALATDLGIDRAPYRAIDLGGETNGLRPGRYLIDDGNNVAYFARPLAKYDAPKAHLFQLIIDGTLGGNLPWGLVLIGVFIAIIMELVGVSSLPFAVGLYLPVTTSGAIFVGGAVRWLVDKKRRDISAAEQEFSPGMLMASGLIAGGAITGVLQSVVLIGEWDQVFDKSSWLGSLAINETWWPCLPFAMMAAGLYWVAVAKKKA